MEPGKRNKWIWHIPQNRAAISHENRTNGEIITIDAAELIEQTYIKYNKDGGKQDN